MHLPCHWFVLYCTVCVTATTKPLKTKIVLAYVKYHDGEGRACIPVGLTKTICKEHGDLVPSVKDMVT